MPILFVWAWRFSDLRYGQSKEDTGSRNECPCWAMSLSEEALSQIASRWFLSAPILSFLSFIVPVFHEENPQDILKESVLPWSSFLFFRDFLGGGFVFCLRFCCFERQKQNFWAILRQNKENRRKKT